MNDEYMRAAANAAQAVVAAVEGRPVDAALSAVKAALDLVPKEMVDQLLTDEAVRRANAIANLAEAEKFG